MISIEFNGETKEVEEGATVSQLLELTQVSSKFCAVELNFEIVPRERYSQTLLKAGDQIEVVTLVGGG
jgi:sulfur carrier protein